MSRNYTRREFVTITAGATALSLIGLPEFVNADQRATWEQGQVAHIIPQANDNRFLIKTSFKTPLSEKPHLSVNGKKVLGEKTDIVGRFWRFDAQTLSPATTYKLQLFQFTIAERKDAEFAPLQLYHNFQWEKLV